MEKKAKASLILGIIGMVMWVLPILGLPISAIGLILGLKGLKSEKRGLAKAGVILCVISLIFGIVNASIGAYMGAKGDHPLVNEILNN